MTRRSGISQRGHAALFATLTVMAAKGASNFTCGSGVTCQGATACPSSLTTPTNPIQAACLYAAQNGFTNAFLFVGAFDWGFYSHALISTQAAARSAELYTSTSSSTAFDQATAACASSPLIVTASSVTGADGQAVSQVTVTYQTLSL